MTRIEAIDLLDNLIGMVDDNHESDYDTALKMAIKALEYDDAKYHEEHGEVIVDKAVWEDSKRALEQEPPEQEPPEQECRNCKHYAAYDETCFECEYEGITKGYTRYEQEPSGDLIRRDDVFNALDRWYSEEGEVVGIYTMIENISPVKPQLCEDAISRSDAIKAIDEKAKRIKNEDTLIGLAGAVAILFELPSVNPQKWIPVSERLPEEPRVLLQYETPKGRTKFVVSWVDIWGRWQNVDENFFIPIAWMPLPSLYQPQEGANE